MIEYLWDAKCAAAAGKWNFDDSGLPDSAAADVAIAATRAVVVVIAMDAIFAVIADVVGI